MGIKFKKYLYISVLALSFGCNVSKQTLNKVEYYKGLIFFDVQTSKGDTLLALFDTGAEVSAINITTSDRLKLPTIDSTQVTGTNATIDVEVVSITNLSLKEYRVDSLSPTKRDLSHSLTPDDRKLDIILGYDFFKNSIVEIDFLKNEMKILEDTIELNYEYYVPFTLDHNIPRFSGMVNGKIKMDFRLDIGASLFETDDIYINITTNDWNRIKVEYSSLAPESYLIATGINNEEIKLPVVRLEKVVIGKFIIDSPYVIVQPEQGYFAFADAVGFVSNNLLSKYIRIAIDYINNRLYYSSLKNE